MLARRSGAEFHRLHGLGGNVDAQDVLFALQLVYLGLRLEPEKIAPDTCLLRLSKLGGILARESASSASLRFVSEWAHMAGLTKDNLGQVSFGQLLKIVKVWRHETSMKDRPWHGLSQEAMLTIIAGKTGSHGALEEHKNCMRLTNSFGGLDLARMEYGIEPGLLAFQLLFLAARDWLDYDDIKARYYHDLRLDEEAIRIIFDTVSITATDGIVPANLLRPEDEISDHTGFDNTFDSILMSIHFELAKSGYQPRRLSEWKVPSIRSSPLSDSPTLHLIALLVEDGLSADR